MSVLLGEKLTHPTEGSEAQDALVAQPERHGTRHPIELRMHCAPAK